MHCPSSFSLFLVAFVACLSYSVASRLQPSTLPTARPGHPVVNDRPIIGILTQPGSPAPKGDSYIAASYVKWVEAAGARVVPIMYDLPKSELRRRFAAINGLLLPGGGANLSPGHPFYDAAASLLEMALDANNKGDYFPVHGTCLGFEALAIIVSRNTSVLSDMDALNAPAPLMYTDRAATSSWLAALPPQVVRHLQEGPLAFENHAHGLLTTTFAENPRLGEFFDVLALSLDNRGLPYISLMQAKNYPVYATQFHPEKHAFEWASFLRIPHSPAAIEVTQEMANFFVSEARRSRHAAVDKLQEEAMLIYNWKPMYTGRHESGEEEQDFQQTYVFDGIKKQHQQQQQGGGGAAGGVKGLLLRWLSWAELGVGVNILRGERCGHSIVSFLVFPP